MRKKSEGVVQAFFEIIYCFEIYFKLLLPGIREAGIR